MGFFSSIKKFFGSEVPATPVEDEKKVGEVREQAPDDAVETSPDAAAADEMAAAVSISEEAAGDQEIFEETTVAVAAPASEEPAGDQEISEEATVAAAVSISEETAGDREISEETTVAAAASVSEETAGDQEISEEATVAAAASTSEEAAGDQEFAEEEVRSLDVSGELACSDTVSAVSEEPAPHEMDTEDADQQTDNSAQPLTDEEEGEEKEDTSLESAGEAEALSAHKEARRSSFWQRWFGTDSGESDAALERDEEKRDEKTQADDEVSVSDVDDSMHEQAEAAGEESDGEVETHAVDEEPATQEVSSATLEEESATEQETSSSLQEALVPEEQEVFEETQDLVLDAETSIASRSEQEGAAQEVSSAEELSMQSLSADGTSAAAPAGDTDNVTVEEEEEQTPADEEEDGEAAGDEAATGHEVAQPAAAKQRRSIWQRLFGGAQADDEPSREVEEEIAEEEDKTPSATQEAVAETIPAEAERGAKELSPAAQEAVAETVFAEEERGADAAGSAAYEDGAIELTQRLDEAAPSEATGDEDGQEQPGEDASNVEEEEAEAGEAAADTSLKDEAVSDAETGEPEEETQPREEKKPAKDSFWSRLFGGAASREKSDAEKQVEVQEESPDAAAMEEGSAADSAAAEDIKDAMQRGEREGDAAEDADASAASGDSSPFYQEMTRRLREADQRLSAWLDIVLEGVDEAGPELNARVSFLLRSLSAPADEVAAFVDDFDSWLRKMDYRFLDEFRSELQYRLSLALEMEDEEDERNRLILKLTDSLAKTRAQFTRHFDSLLSSHGELDEDFWEELEELFIMADLGVETSMELSRRLQERARKEKVTTTDALRGILREEIRQIFVRPRHIVGVNPPEVVLMTGVNGAGKTTTIAKLAYRDKMQGKKVMIAAADTFRAAAIDQMRVWAERVGTLFHARQPGADPASVAYEAIDLAMQEHVDVLYIDTAGRLQTKVDLMNELGKVRKVIARRHPGAPHRTVLVLDATTGQNALSQARIFKEATGVDELILTKLDGTAKGGVAIAVAMQYQLPISFVGLGEKVEDLRPFNGDDYADALFRND